MRITRPLLAALLALLVVVGFAPHASAQEEDETTTEAEIGHAEHLCIETLEGGGAIDDCQEAPNPLLPEVNEIIWGAIGFFVVFFFVWKMGYPAIKKGLDARTERIRADVQAAESQRAEADQLLTDYRAQLADARSEASRIIEEARQVGESMRRDQEARLQTELAEMRSRAAADIEVAKGQAISDLRGEVAKLAVGAAEVVVQKNLDQATQVQLIENYINQVAQQRS
ncbi:MAG: F0F1 ATP synthase subunit B [Acidimicrobiia bacterium]